MGVEWSGGRKGWKKWTPKRRRNVSTTGNPEHERECPHEGCEDLVYWSEGAYRWMEHDHSDEWEEDDQARHEAEHAAEKRGDGMVDRRVCQGIGCPYGDAP